MEHTSSLHFGDLYYYLLCIILSFMSLYGFIRPVCLTNLFIILRNSMSLHVITEWLHTYICNKDKNFYCSKHIY